MKAYLILASPKFVNREQIQALLDQTEEVSWWYACLPNTVFCTSSLSADGLAELIEGAFGDAKSNRFMVMQCHSNSQGRLPPQAWHLMENPDNPRLPDKNKT